MLNIKRCQYATECMFLTRLSPRNIENTTSIIESPVIINNVDLCYVQMK